MAFVLHKKRMTDPSAQASSVHALILVRPQGERLSAHPKRNDVAPLRVSWLASAAQAVVTGLSA